jgi:hypothetical protein
VLIPHAANAQGSTFFPAPGGGGFGIRPRITVPCRPANAWYAPHPYYPEKPCGKPERSGRKGPRR